MTVEIKDPEAVAAIEREAMATGLSPSEVVQTALKNRSNRTAQTEDPSVDEILAFVRDARLKRINENLSDEQILGYGPDGYCQ